MTRNEISQKVRQRIDEVGVNEVISLNFPIDPFINEATNQTMFDSPINLASNVVDFSDYPITQNEDGSGEVALPENFGRLVEFKMEGWSYSISTPIVAEAITLARQANPITRGNPARPVVLLKDDRLLYFSVCGEYDHEIAIAKAQVYKKSFADFPDTLSDAISWLTASKVLQVMNEDELSKSALQQYVEIVANFKR
ncbi:MAG: hypothetical protein R3Y50_05235 [Rikenellaceae bacterium]